MSTNLLLGISIVMVGIILISINYSSIDNFYKYSEPFQKIEFETIDQYCDSECKTVLQSQGYNCYNVSQSNFFCFPPLNYNKIQEQQDYWIQLIPYNYGYLDLLYDDKEISLGLIKKINIIDEKNVGVTFSTDENSKFMHAEISDFDYTENKILTIGDTFIPKCHNQSIHVYKLHDVAIHEDVSFAIFVYRIGTSDIQQCVFPQTLEHNFGVKFD